MLRRGIALSVAALLLLTNTSAIQIRRVLGKGEFAQVRQEPEITDSSLLEETESETSEPVAPLILSADQLDSYRYECCQYIDRWLGQGYIDERIAENYRQLQEEIIADLINEGDIEKFESAIESCQSDNEYYNERDRRTPTATEPPAPESSNNPTPDVTDPVPDVTDPAPVRERVTFTDEQIEELRVACTQQDDRQLEAGEVSQEKYDEGKGALQRIIDGIIEDGDADLYWTNLSRCREE
ncbi:UNKNOWN [Stylonychia lemnae]|uniref:Uncharacterized protein n=1 Tax=Stylonychia lemnae TaxID=5949 RepID=A0A078A2N9_STYLE|nr:UNKNOWN [Stylonychia lemnae]|eukprot:CDW76092.1 UNKNOWN [Stylonychia lemnae]